MSHSPQTVPAPRNALRRVLAATILTAALGGAYAFLAPKWYRAVLTVVPATPQPKSGISTVLGAVGGGLAAGLETSLGGSADANRIAAVLQSNAVSDAVIAKLNLRSRYDVRYLENAREELWKHCDVKTLLKPNLVQLSCEDKDPQFVQQLLGVFADYGNQVFRRVSAGSASEEVRFLERRVAELRQQAEESASRMREFQEKYKIVDLDTQARAVVSALAALNSQRITKQLELDYARTFSSRDESTARQLESQLLVVRDRLRQLEDQPSPTGAVASVKGNAKEGSSGMFPPALQVPKIRAEAETLYRDRKVSETTLVFALERLENARANEARDVSTFLVLDPPVAPTRKSRPKRAIIVLLAAALGCVVSAGYEAVRGAGGVRVVVELLGARPQRIAAKPEDVDALQAVADRRESGHR